MAHVKLTIRKGEEGMVQPITIKNDDGALIPITFAVLADTKIEIKDQDDPTIIKSTITNTDFTFGVSIVNWTPTEAQVTTEIGVGEFNGYVFLRDNAGNREEIAKFILVIEDV